MSLESCFDATCQLLGIMFDKTTFIGAAGVMLGYAGVWKLYEHWDKRKQEIDYQI